MGLVMKLHWGKKIVKVIVVGTVEGYGELLFVPSKQHQLEPESSPS